MSDDVFLKGAVSLPTADTSIQVSGAEFSGHMQSPIFYENKIYSIQALPSQAGTNPIYGLCVCDRNLENNKILHPIGIYGAYSKFAIMGRFAYLYLNSGTTSASVLYKINLDTNEKEEITLSTPVSFGVGLLSIDNYLYAVGNLFNQPSVDNGSNNYVYRSSDGVNWQKIHDQDIMTSSNLISYDELSTYPPSKNYNVGDPYVPYFLGSGIQAFAFNSKIYAGFIPLYHSRFYTYAIYEFDLTTTQWTLAFVAKPPIVSTSDYDVSLFTSSAIVSVDDSVIRLLLCNTPSQGNYPTHVGEITISKDGSQSFSKSVLPTGSPALKDYQMSLYTSLNSKNPVGFIDGQWFFIGVEISGGTVSGTNKRIIYNSSERSWSEQTKSVDPLTIPLPFVDFNDKIWTVGSDLTRLYCSSDGINWEKSTNLPFAFKQGCLLFSYQNQLIFFDCQQAFQLLKNKASNSETATSELQINWHTFNGQTWVSEIKSLNLGASAPYLLSYPMTKHWQQVIVGDKLIIPISIASSPSQMLTCLALNLNTFGANAVAVPTPMFYQNDAQIATIQGVVQIPDIAAGDQLIVGAGSMITNYAIADTYFGTNSRVASPLIQMGS